MRFYNPTSQIYAVKSVGEILGKRVLIWNFLNPPRLKSIASISLLSSFFYFFLFFIFFTKEEEEIRILSDKNNNDDVKKRLKNKIKKK